MKQIEIFWKLISYELEFDKFFMWKELKNQIFNSLLKWCKEWFLHNSKMMIIWEWKCSLLNK